MGRHTALVLRRSGQPAIVLGRVGGLSVGAQQRSAQAIGDEISTALGIPYARELTDTEARAATESTRSLRFVVIALVVLFVGLGGIFAMSQCGESGSLSEQHGRGLE